MTKPLLRLPSVELREKDEEIAKQKAEYEAEIAEKDAEIAKQAAEIKRLKEKLRLAENK